MESFAQKILRADAVSTWNTPQRVACTICTLDSSVLVFGGYNDKSLDRNFYFLKDTGLIRINLEYPGRGFAQNILFYADSVLYVGGGMDTNSSEYSQADFWKFDFRSQRWTRLDDLPFNYIGVPNVERIEDLGVFATASRFISRKSLVSTIIYRFSFDNETWIEESACPDPRLFHAHSFVVKNELYFFFESEKYANRFSGVTMKYDFLNKAWTSLARFSFTPRFGTFSFTDGNNLYVGGGMGEEPFDVVYVFDPDQKVWKLNMSLDRTIITGTTWELNGRHYLGFGVQSGRGYRIWRLYAPE